MIAKLDMLLRGIAAMPRRRVFHAAAGAGLGAVVAADIPHRQAAAKRKKKGKRKDSCICPPPPRCPESCSFIFTEVSGKSICALGGGTGFTCTPCSASNPCTDADRPHCVKDVLIINTGRTMRMESCEPYSDGVCAAVLACVT
jgi:hypothetical protein